MPVRGGTLLAVFTLRCISANTWVQPALWNTHWNNDAFLVVRNVPLKRCVEECQVRDRCKAVNYWRVRRNCELMDDDVTTLLEPGGGHPCLAIAKKDMGQTSECKDCGRVCGADSGRTPRHLKECLPPVVDHGYFLGNMLSIGATKRLICNEFYKPEAGADRMKCQDDGGWDPQVSCAPSVYCGTPLLVENALTGEIIGPAFPGTVVVYSCAANYFASPVNSALSLTCMASMDWTSVDFECLKDCGTPPLVLNANAGAISGRAFPGTLVVYSCNPEYVASTENSGLSVTCQTSGLWTHVGFQCLRDCGTPPLVANATAGAINGHAVPGTVVVYSCAADYVASPLNSALSRTCQTSGEWTNVDFNCYRDCVDGWKQYEGSFYCISNEEITFYQAKEYCKEHGATLLHVDDSLENNFIKSMLTTEDGTSSFWLGLTDEAVEGEWRWVDNNEIATFTDWTDGEPNNYSEEDCGCIWRDNQLKWNDVACTYDKLRAICEKNVM